MTNFVYDEFFLILYFPSEKYFYLKDHLGNIRVTIDNDSSEVGYNDYYPFGKQMPERCMNNANSEDIYKFSGKELDEEYELDIITKFTPLNSGGARYYDPAIGRWMSVDPMAEKYPSLNPYNYCANNPLNYFDLDGNVIYRAGEEISPQDARDLTMKTIGDYLSGSRNSAIDFYSEGNIFIDTWNSIRGVNNDYEYGFGSSNIRLGQNVYYDSKLGEQPLNSMDINTRWMSDPITKHKVSLRATNAQGERIITANFETAEGNSVIQLAGTLDQLNSTLGELGYGIQETKYIKHYKIEENGSKTPVYDYRYEIIKRDNEEED